MSEQECTGVIQNSPF